jgi:hypothetical protein
MSFPAGSYSTIGVEIVVTGRLAADTDKPLHVNSLLVLDTKKYPHGILIFHEAEGRTGDSITQKPLCLRGKSLGLLGRHHEKLVFSGSINRLA